MAIEGGVRVTIFKSAETVRLILLCYLGDAIKYTESADLKMVARNRPLVAMIFLEKSYFNLKTTSVIII